VNNWKVGYLLSWCYCFCCWW